MGDNMYVYLKDLKPTYNIIDIRDNNEYNIDHVLNSVNIPMKELLNKHFYYLDKNKKYYIYCTSGVRSRRTCELLNALGYNVINVIDGFGK